MSSLKVPAAARFGLNQITCQDVLNDPGLVAPEKIRPASVADPWGPAIAFGGQLAAVSTDLNAPQKRSTALRLFELYLRGFLCGKLTLARLPLVSRDGNPRGLLTEALLGSANREWAQNLRAEGLLVLKTEKDTVLAVHHPDVLFFPAAAGTGWPTSPGGEEELELSGLEIAIENEVDNLYANDLQLAELYFEALSRLVEPFDAGVEDPDWKEAARAIHDARGEARSESDSLLKRRLLREPSWKAAAEAAKRTQRATAPEPRAVANPAADSSERILVRVIGDRHVPIQLRRAVLDLSGLLVSRVIGRRLPGGGYRWPDSPVRGTELARVADVRVVELHGDDPPTYEVRLTSGWQARYTPRALERVDDLAPVIAVWPGEARAGWNHASVYYTPGPGETRTRWPARYWRSDPETVPDACDDLAAVTVLDFRPRWIEVLGPGEDGVVEELGLFAPDGEGPAVQGPVGGRIRLAIDFGTANTCVATLDPATAHHRPVDFSVDWRTILGSDDDIDSAFRNGDLTRLVGSAEVPSELLAATFNIETSLEREGRLPILGVDAGDRGDVRLELIRQGLLLSGFKWSDASLWPEELLVDVARERIDEAAHKYLLQLLRAAVRELVPAGVTDVQLRCGYPQAFDEDQLVEHRDRIVGVAGAVSRQSGINIAPDCLVSESLAALWELCLDADNRRFEHLLVIDVGGGTADYALSRSFDPVQVRGEQDAGALDVRSSSLRFAGNAILGAAASLMKDLESFRFSEARTPRLQAIARTLLLARQVRRLGESTARSPLEAVVPATEGWPVTRQLAQINRDEVSGAVDDAIYDGFLAIAYFGALMLASRLHEGHLDADGPAARVRILLTGNGWSLAGLHSGGFGRWRQNPSDREREFGEEVFRAAWRSICSDDILGFGTRQRLDDVTIDVQRHPGKKMTAAGMVIAPGLPFTHELPRLPASSEPLGVRCGAGNGEIPPWQRLPIVETERIGAPDHIWGLPARLADRLGGSGTVLAELTRLVANRTEGGRIWKNIVAGAGGIQPGTYLWSGPLRRYLEEHLPGALGAR